MNTKEQGGKSVDESVRVLNLPMQDNESGAKTIRGYLKALLRGLWEDGEGFSGKRPFGNSGWEYDIYRALVKAKLVKGKLDSDGCIETVDSKACDKIILAAIKDL